MPGPIARWILSRVVRSGLAFETEAIDAYRRLQKRVAESPPADSTLGEGLAHLLEEEETHWRILRDAAEGKLLAEDLERLLEEHRFSGLQNIRPLQGAARDSWAAELRKALEQEEKTWVFYSNLRRMSKVPVVKKTFELLAGMEKEHLDILRRLLGVEHARPASRK